MSGPDASRITQDESSSHAAHDQAAPHAVPPGPQGNIMALQHAAGNAAVSRALQGQMRGGRRGLVRRQPAGPDAEGVCPVCGKRGKGRCPDCGQPFAPVQRSATAPGAAPGGLAAVQATLQANAGQPLDPGTRGQMEGQFGQDFGPVRVHTGIQAAESAQAINARAYTVGSNIVFRAGHYAPQTADGQRLLAHELTHVVQQGTQGNQTPTDALTLGPASDPAEQQAEQAASAIGQNGALPPLHANTPPRVQRDIFDQGKEKEHQWPPGYKQGLSSTLPYREATELNKCVDIMGVESAQYCRHEVLGEKAGPEHISKLLKAFEGKFKAAAPLIRQSREAMALVFEAEDKRVQFGGYTEDGPRKDTWPYTVGNKVYIPKARTDPVLAMNGFLFELNNAIRHPKFEELSKEVGKGKKGTLTAQTFAYKTVEQEVEGMLRLGQVWIDAKKANRKDKEWTKYDINFYQTEYKAYKDGTKTKDDLIKDVLQRKYTEGVDKGKTVEQYYKEEYKRIGGK